LHPGSGRYVAADEATLRRLAGAIDREAVEQALGGWLSGRLRRGKAARARRGRKPTKPNRKRKAAGQRRARCADHRPPLAQVAVDGKVVRGAGRAGEPPR
jgi:Arc/MetJ family transcription regulator